MTQSTALDGLRRVADPVSETSAGWYSRSLRQQAASVLWGCSAAESSEDPVLVESLGELAKGEVELLDGLEGPDPQDLLFERADEPLDAAAPLRLPDEGGAGLDADDLELILEGVGDELASVVVSERGSGGDADLVVALGVPDGLPQALDGLEAGSSPCRVCPEALAVHNNPRTLSK